MAQRAASAAAATRTAVTRGPRDYHYLEDPAYL